MERKGYRVKSDKYTILSNECNGEGEEEAKLQGEKKAPFTTGNSRFPFFDVVFEASGDI